MIGNIHIDLICLYSTSHNLKDLKNPMLMHQFFFSHELIQYINYVKWVIRVKWREQSLMLI